MVNVCCSIGSNLLGTIGCSIMNEEITCLTIVRLTPARAVSLALSGHAIICKRAVGLVGS